jgi:hypothetical protein
MESKFVFRDRKQLDVAGVPHQLQMFHNDWIREAGMIPIRLATDGVLQCRRRQGFTDFERFAGRLSLRSTVLFLLFEAVCLVCFDFAADEKGFGSCQCRLIILFSTGGATDETAGTTGSVGCNAKSAGTS